MAIPYRGRTTESTYFVTANVLKKNSLFRVQKIARLFIEIMFAHRAKKKYFLHEFVVMPDHFHLILTPTGITLERAMQLIKGRFSFELNKALKRKRDPCSQASSTAGSGTLLNIKSTKTTSGRIR